MRPLLRIISAPIILVTLIAAVTFCIIRQPSFHHNQDKVGIHASPERLRRDVVWLTTNHVPRSADHPENLAPVAAYLAEKFSRSGGVVTRQRFVARGRSYENVIASFGHGDGPALIVGAHYDVFSERVPFPGADDNASGVASLLELSRVLSRYRLNHRVDLVAYANEEPPFFGSDEMGSAIHADSLPRSQRPPMICLEMVGYFTARQPSTGSLLDYLVPRSGDFVVIAGGWSDRRLARKVRNAFNASSKSVDAYSLTLPRTWGIDASDQSSYWKRGFHAVMITDTAYIRNPNYHTVRDTAETLDYERMVSVVDGVVDVVVRKW